MQLVLRHLHCSRGKAGNYAIKDLREKLRWALHRQFQSHTYITIALHNTEGEINLTGFQPLKLIRPRTIRLHLPLAKEY